jgi:hypothetical protein
MSMEATVEWYWWEKPKNSEKNMSRCHSVHHKSHGLTWASKVRGRLLTAWTMAQPKYCVHYVYCNGKYCTDIYCWVATSSHSALVENWTKNLKMDLMLWHQWQKKHWYSNKCTKFIWKSFSVMNCRHSCWNSYGNFEVVTYIALLYRPDFCLVQPVSVSKHFFTCGLSP